MISVIYSELCPICNGDLSWNEIEREWCEKNKKNLSDNSLSKKYRDFEIFFTKLVGSKPRAIQSMWAKRILSGYSFAAIAPTGIGKTLFGIVMALYFSTTGRKSYILVPTTILLKEAKEKMEKFGFEDDVAYYYGNMGKKKGEEMKNRIRNGEFKLLITTTAFLSRNYPLVRNLDFSFVFVDDVDSLLKRSKNVEKIVDLVTRGKGVLMVSTATGSRGYNTRILREKLNFDVGNMRNAVRNVEDIYGSKDALLEIINSMGPGGVIFTPSAEEAKELTLKLKNYRAGLVISEEKDAFEKFKRGDLDFLVGVAAPYGAIIRGVDMPKRIRYVIFYGMPRFKIGLENIDSIGEKIVLSLAYSLAKKYDLEKMLEKKDLDALREKIKEILSNEKQVEGEGFIYENGYILFPDIKTYIQGSGRASRLYAGGITKGASFLLDSENSIRVFVNRASVYGIEFKPLQSLDLKALKEDIDMDRKKIDDVRESKDVIEPLLFIVESPNKAKHIARFFGKPNVRIIKNSIVYEVATGKNVLVIAPSLGHVVDLSTSRGYHGVIVNHHDFIPVYSPIRKCRKCGYQFTEGDKCPVCNSNDIYNAKYQIETLRHLAQETGKVIIGTDPDTEGEKIAWDLMNLLRPYATAIRRAEFHEVTKEAIINAINSSREMNENLVKAQIVRRIEDRWIGFELSQILWHRFSSKNLSAGRAQTPVLGWAIDRYRQSLKKTEAWFIPGTDVKVPWKGEIWGTVSKIDEMEKEYTLPPYTTDEILKDSFSILGIDSSDTMNILQNLFETGLITYHRTDSTHVSDAGRKIARMYLGKDYHGRKWGEPGAHECIRPTKPWGMKEIKRYIDEGIINITIDEKSLKVYDLIFRRFMASQSVGKLKVVKYSIKVGEDEIEFPLVVDAYGKAYELYPYRVKIHKEMKTGYQKIDLEKRTISPPPYTQADLIRLMKERGIGRPSTYATIISKLFKRKYIVERRGRIIPTSRGTTVYEFLSTNYGPFIREERTRMLEKIMTEIEKGERDYTEVLHDLYDEMKKLRGK